MKHVPTFRPILPLAVTIFGLAFGGCDDGAPELHGSRLEGTFQLDAIQVRAVWFVLEEIRNDTLITVSSRPHIHFEGSDDPSTLRVHLAEFLNATQLATFRALIGSVNRVESHIVEKTRATVNGNEWRLLETGFIADVTYPAMGAEQTVAFPWDQLSGQGRLDEGVLTFEFRMLAESNDESLELTGTATGQKL